MKASPPLELSFHRIAMACFATAGSVALLILLAWRLGRPGTGVFDLAAGLAVLLLGVSVAAWMCHRQSDSAAANRVGLVIGLGTLAMSSLMLCQNLFGLTWPVEEWFANTLAARGVTPRAHINAEPVVGCLLASLACLFEFRSSVRSRVRRQMAAIPALVVLVLGLVIFLCYLLQSPFFEHSTLLTGVELSLLGLGLLLTAGPEIWPLKLVFLPPPEATSRRQWVWGVVSLVLLLGLTVVATRLYYFTSQRSIAIRAAQRGMTTIADLKAAQIADWRKERLADADYIHSSSFATRRALDFLRQPKFLSTETKLRDWLQSVFASRKVEQMILLDEQLNVRLVHPKGADAVLREADRRAAEQALSSKEVVVVDLHRAADGRSANLDFAIPFEVRREGTNGNVWAGVTNSRPMDLGKGVLILQVNASTALNPVLRTWPTSSRTAETMLVRQDGDEVVCLNRLRHQTNAAMTVRLPLDRRYVEARAVLGVVNQSGTIKGATKGNDFRGLPVVAVVRKIPDAPWVMIAKMDEEEVLAPVRRQGWVTAGIVGVLIGTAMLCIRLLGRQRHLDSIRRELLLERQRRESEAKFRTLFESSRDAIMLLDRATYLDCNPAALELFGCATKKQFLAKRPGELSPPRQPDGTDSPEAVQVHVAAAYARGKDFSEWLFQRQDGTVFPAEMHLSRVELGEKTVLQAMVRDITERKRAEEALLEEQSLMRLLMDNIPDAIYFKDTEGCFTRINWALARQYGLNDPAQAVGKTDFDFYTEERARPAYEDEQSIIRSGQPLVGKEEKETRLDGQTAWVSTTKMPLRDEKGKTIGTFGISRDITAHKQAEADRLVLSKLESTGVLAGGIAHDFNNLLTIITMNLGLAESGSSSREDLAHCLKASKQAVLAAGNLTQQLITFAQKGAVFRQPTDLAGVIQESVSATLSGFNVRSEVSVAPGLRRADMDGGQIGQVIRNLALNAREAMSDGGAITIRAENVVVKAQDGLKLAPGEYVRVSVRDQGHGIPADVLPKIFDPYFSTKQRGTQKGMGLGLTICHSVIQKHGGVITVDTKVGKGTTFAFYLPACPPG
jgi:PAS domain S-box-containing protein